MGLQRIQIDAFRHRHGNEFHYVQAHKNIELKLKKMGLRRIQIDAFRHRHGNEFHYVQAHKNIELKLKKMGLRRFELRLEAVHFMLEGL
jgi:hypothetical protein